MCACEVGWEGNNCEICVRLPGCENGNCTNEFECNCHDGWSGACCNVRKYCLFVCLIECVLVGRKVGIPPLRIFPQHRPTFVTAPTRHSS